MLARSQTWKMADLWHVTLLAKSWWRIYGDDDEDDEEDRDDGDEEEEGYDEDDEDDKDDEDADKDDDHHLHFAMTSQRR